MNKSIAIVIGSIVGAAIGGGVVYVYLNKKYDVIFERETESYREEISELKETNETLNKRLVAKLGKAKAEFFDKENVADVDQISIDDLTADEEAEDDDEEYDSESVKKTSNDIRFISKKDYDDDDEYEKEVFEYYMSDGVILQDEEVLDAEEFEEVCGNAALPLLKKDKSLSRWSSGGDNELYIRNEMYATDYKIKRYHKAYDD